MVHMEKHTKIHAPLHNVFSYVVDPGHSTEWIAGMESAGNISGSAKGDRFDWTFRMAGMTFKGKSEIIDQKEDALQVIHSSGGIEATWTFDFHEEEGDTVLDLAIDYQVPIPLLGKLAEKVIMKQNENAMEESLASLKSNLEH